MKEEERIKRQAGSCFAEGRIAEGFGYLGLLGPSELCKFLFGHNKLITRGETAAYFWKDYLPASPLFGPLMALEKDALHLLHHYFSINSFVSPALLARLSEEHPALLLTAIRVNQAFLNSYHSESLLFLERQPDAFLRDHASVCQALAAQHKRLQQAFFDSLEPLADLPFADLMNDAAIWFEEKRARLPEGPEGILILQHVKETIDLFLDRYILRFGDRMGDQRMTDGAALRSQWQVLGDCLIAQAAGMLEERPVWKSLSAASHYWQFATGPLDTYCFDLNYTVSRDGQFLTVSPHSPALLEAWHAEGKKWHYLMRQARDKALLKLPPEASVPGTPGEEAQMELGLRLEAAMEIARYFCLAGDGLDRPGTEALIRTVHAFGSNAYARMGWPLDRMNEREPSKWLLHLAQVLKSFPVRLVRHTNADFLRSFLERFVPEEVAAGLAGLLVHDIRQAQAVKKPSQRLALQLSSTPFIRVGEACIALNGILCETELTVSVLLALLDHLELPGRQEEQKAESAYMEEQLAALFRQAGFSKVVSGKRFYKKQFGVDGDFDVLVYEEGLLLCLELKRVRPRIFLGEIWDQYRLSVLNAARQLDKANGLLRHKLPLLKTALIGELGIPEVGGDRLRIESLIVSTSFEHDHRLIEGKYLKLSLFEVQELLRELASRGGGSLQELVDSLHAGTYWKDKIGPEPVDPDKAAFKVLRELPPGE